MNIRVETKRDYENIYELVKTAFETAKVSNGEEQDFVIKLREGSGYLHELALVAEEDDQLIGHIMFTVIKLKSGEKSFEVLLLAPLSVKLDYRSKGIGGALIKEGLLKAKKLGFQAVFLVGDPNYYGKFGFRTASDYRIISNEEIPPQYVLAYELSEGYLEGKNGVVFII